MARTDPEQSFRLALSHREKARNLARQSDEALRNGDIDANRYETLHGQSTEQLAVAESTLARLREEQRSTVAELRHRLRAAELEQANLSREASSGTMPPRKANEANRAILRKAQRVSEELAKCQALLAADSPGDLGGFVDLSWDRYLRLNLNDLPALRPVHRVASAIIPLVMTAAVFLPWMVLGTVSFSLMSLASYVEQRGLPAPLPPPALRVMWIAYALAPLLSAPLMAWRDERRLARALVIAGAVLSAAALLPVLLFGAPAGADRTFLGVVGAIRWGAGLYLAGGLAAVILGARRTGSPGTTLRASLRGALAFGIAIAAVLTVLMAVLGTLSKGGTLVMEPPAVDAVSGKIRLTCRNRGTQTASLVVPWPQGGYREAAGDVPGPAFGVEAYVRERGSDTFHLLPDTQNLWEVWGVPAHGSDPVILRPGFALGIGFDAAALRTLGLDVEVIRIDLVDSKGRSQTGFEVVPVVPRVPRGAAAKPAPVPIHNQPAVWREPREPGAGPGTVHEPAAPAIPGVYRVLVRVTGSVGDRVSLALTNLETGIEESRFVEPGETVIEHWVLQEVDKPRRRVTLRNRRTNETRVLDRGHEEELVFSSS